MACDAVQGAEERGERGEAREEEEAEMWRRTRTKWRRTRGKLKECSCKKV